MFLQVGFKWRKKPVPFCLKIKPDVLLNHTDGYTRLNLKKMFFFLQKLSKHIWNSLVVYIHYKCTIWLSTVQSRPF